METPDGRKWYLVCIKWEYRFLSPCLPYRLLVGEGTRKWMVNTQEAQDLCQALVKPGWMRHRTPPRGFAKCFLSLQPWYTGRASARARCSLTNQGSSPNNGHSYLIIRSLEPLHSSVWGFSSRVLLGSTLIPPPSLPPPSSLPPAPYLRSPLGRQLLSEAVSETWSIC